MIEEGHVPACLGRGMRSGRGACGFLSLREPAPVIHHKINQTDKAGMSGVSSQAGIPFSPRSEHVTKAKHRHVFNDPRPSVIDGLIFHVFRLSSLPHLRPPASPHRRSSTQHNNVPRRISIIHPMLLVQRSPSIANKHSSPDSPHTTSVPAVPF